MSEMNQRQRQTRENLRSVGLLVTIIGGIFTLVGFVSFFSSFSSFSPPRYFWCAFIGLPLLAVGGNLMHYGYMGAVSRYVAGEVAPVAKDTVDYLASETEDAMQKVGKAVGEGIAQATSPQGPLVRCHRCNHENHRDAKFCSECGAALLKSKQCQQCGELNDPDARFCDNCGGPF
jgi:ribosomal protein L40E